MAPTPDRRPVVIASQMGPRFDAALQRRLPPGTSLHSIDRGVPQALPPGTTVLLAMPMWRQREAPAPAGWPFGLDWVQLAAVGIDGYPGWLLTTVPASAARGTASPAIAEYVIGAVFAAAKDLPSLWIRDPAQWALRPTGSVAGSTLGLYGWGSIAREVARRALALGQRVIALRRSDAPLDLPGAERAADLGELLRESDHLVLAAPATPETRHVIDAAALAQAKPGLHLVNVARGSLLDQDALLAALDDGRVARATLDVTDPEPLPAGHPLYAHPRVFISPHTSAIGTGPEQALIDLLLRNLHRHAQGEPLAHAPDLARGY